MFGNTSYGVLERTWDPEQLGPRGCESCGVVYEVKAVRVVVNDCEACPECIEYFGKRNPERFPTIEEYRAALEAYPEPLSATYGDYEPPGDAVTLVEKPNVNTIPSNPLEPVVREKERLIGVQEALIDALQSELSLWRSGRR